MYRSVSLFIRKDLQALEAVQKRFIGKISLISGLAHHVQLKRFNPFFGSQKNDFI